MCSNRHLFCAGSRGVRDTGVFVTTDSNFFQKWLQGNYIPTMRYSTAPTKMPNKDEDVDNIPKRMYPTIAPIFSGVYVRLRFNLRIIRNDFVSGDIWGLFFRIRIMEIHLIAVVIFIASLLRATRFRIHHNGNISYLIILKLSCFKISKNSCFFWK